MPSLIEQYDYSEEREHVPFPPSLETMSMGDAQRSLIAPGYQAPGCQMNGLQRVISRLLRLDRAEVFP